MQRVIIILALVIAVAIGAYLVSGDRPDPSTGTPGTIASEQDNGKPLEQEAKEHVADLTNDTAGTIDIESADGFVSGDQSLSLNQGQKPESTSIGELAADDSLSPDSPVTLVRENQQIEVVSLASLMEQTKRPSNPCIEESVPEKEQTEVNLEKKIRVFENGEVIEVPLSELIAKYNNNLEQEISVVTEVEHHEVTTKEGIIQHSGLDKDQEIKVIKQRYGPETATIDELLGGEKFEEDNRIYYVRNVQTADAQGIWGIIHDGLVKNFACGIALKRGEGIKKYQVDIPTNSDELRQDSSSSFLGQMIDKKTAESHVYNRDKGKMGADPNIVYPEQEIVIVGFMPEELVAIYQHFVERVAD